MWAATPKADWICALQIKIVKSKQWQFWSDIYAVKTKQNEMKGTYVKWWIC